MPKILYRYHPHPDPALQFDRKPSRPVAGMTGNGPATSGRGPLHTHEPWLEWVGERSARTS